MVKVSQVNSVHYKNWTCILKRREYFKVELKIIIIKTCILIKLRKMWHSLRIISRKLGLVTQVCNLSMGVKMFKSCV
jgi:hypothetical protein